MGAGLLARAARQSQCKIHSAPGCHVGAGQSQKVNADHFVSVYFRSHDALKAMQLLSVQQAADVVRPAWARLVVP